MCKGQCRYKEGWIHFAGPGSWRRGGEGRCRLQESVCSHKEGCDGKMSPSCPLAGVQCESIGSVVAGGLRETSRSQSCRIPYIPTEYLTRAQGSECFHKAGVIICVQKNSPSLQQTGHVMRKKK